MKDWYFFLNYYIFVLQEIIQKDSIICIMWYNTNKSEDIKSLLQDKIIDSEGDNHDY